MENINREYDRLQQKYGSQELTAVYGAGDMHSPRVALVFMNPTKRNIATAKDWLGIKAQWLGTKQVWEFLFKCGLIDEDIYLAIKSKKPNEWSCDFASAVYDNVTKNRVWITNLAKCSQDDARPLPDETFVEYRELLLCELDYIRPEKIILFGNQVSTIVLGENISVSQSRKKKYSLGIGDREYDCYAVYYPVGNGRFNQPKAIEDISYILSK